MPLPCVLFDGQAAAEDHPTVVPGAGVGGGAGRVILRERVLVQAVLRVLVVEQLTALLAAGFAHRALVLELQRVDPAHVDLHLRAAEEPGGEGDRGGVWWVTVW